MSRSATPWGITQRAIRWHYDLATPFYRLLWGPHIHHGLWDGDESAARAQAQLTERLAAAAGITFGMEVLDVGCGMGGSAIHLARQYGCRVRGMTLSPVQRLWATLSARWHGVGARVRFERRDAEQAVFPVGSFDVIWSVECTEHLFDKPAFFRRAAPWLKPGGRMAICAWLAGDRPHTAAVTTQIDAVCEGFLCPSLGTGDDYQTWMRDAGLVMEAAHDWTARVERTWEICERRIRASGVKWLARRAGPEMARFASRFDTIRQAFLGGAMKYGCFVFRRPA